MISRQAIIFKPKIMALGAMALIVPMPAVAACSCAAPAANDACVVGAWTGLGDGVMSWIADENLPIQPVDPPTIAMTFTQDGQFVTEPFEITFEMAMQGMSATGSSDVGAATGCWQTSGDQLTLCYDDGGPSQSVTVSVMGMTRQMDDIAPKIERADMAYSCEGTTLTTTVAVDGHSPVVTTMQRQ